LVEGREVVNGIKGFKKLTKEQIKELYGSPPIFEKLCWPETEKKLENIETANWTNAGY
jgi:hypothetical protein